VPPAPAALSFGPLATTPLNEPLVVWVMVMMESACCPWSAELVPPFAASSEPLRMKRLPPELVSDRLPTVTLCPYRNSVARPEVVLNVRLFADDRAAVSSRARSVLSFKVTAPVKPLLLALRPKCMLWLLSTVVPEK
jgi:hypothetical protein